MRSGLASGKDCARSGLYCNDFDSGIFFLEILADACDRSACADACYEDVYFAVHLIPDLRSRRLPVRRGVCRVRELSEDDGSFDLIPELLCLFDRSGHALAALCQDELCAVGLQELSSLNAHRLRQSDDHFVSSCCRDQTDTDARVSARRLDQSVARLDQAFFFRVYYHLEADSVLHRSGGVEALKLRKYIRIVCSGFRGEGSRLKNGCVTYKFCCAFYYLFHFRVSFLYFVLFVVIVIPFLSDPHFRSPFRTPAPGQKKKRDVFDLSRFYADS